MDVDTICLMPSHNNKHNARYTVAPDLPQRAWSAGPSRRPCDQGSARPTPVEVPASLPGTPKQQAQREEGFARRPRQGEGPLGQHPGPGRLAVLQAPSGRPCVHLEHDIRECGHCMNALQSEAQGSTEWEAHGSCSPDQAVQQGCKYSLAGPACTHELDVCYCTACNTVAGAA